MSHLIQIYTVCPLVFEFLIWYSLDITVFENMQTKILLSAFLVLKELNTRFIIQGIPECRCLYCQMSHVKSMFLLGINFLENLSS